MSLIPDCIVLQDFALDVEEFRKLPQVMGSGCPEEFMELAFLSSKVSFSFEQNSTQDLFVSLGREGEGRGGETG